MFSNEELAARIAAGDRGCYETLWKQVERFAKQQAGRYLLNIKKGIVDAEDLAQESFLAMIEAAQIFDPGRGTLFTTVYGNYLHKHFREAGYFNDAATNAASLDVPLPDGETTLEDIQPDMHDEPAEVEEKIFAEQLHEALNQALAAIDQEDADAIRQHFYEGRTLKSIAEVRGETVGTVAGRKTRGLQQLYRNARKSGLEEFLDERTDFYRQTAFKRTHTSTVERAVLRREKLRGKNGLTITAEGPEG